MIVQNYDTFIEKGQETTKEKTFKQAYFNT